MIQMYNHQYNRIVQEGKNLLSALQTSTDRKVVEAARYSAVSKAVEACEGLTGDAMRLVERLADIQTNEQFQVYQQQLSQYVVPFPELTEREIKGLFPKVKKLRVPDLEAIKGQHLAYLGWTDAGTNRLFIVYPLYRDGHVDMIGIEGKFLPMERKEVCAFCRKHGEAALFTAISKAKMANLPDYYKAVGQCICLDYAACNSKITDLEPLEKFVEAVSR